MKQYVMMCVIICTVIYTLFLMKHNNVFNYNVDSTVYEEFVERVYRYHHVV